MAKHKNKIVRGVRASVLGFLSAVGLFIGAFLVLAALLGILAGIVSLISLVVGDHEWFVAAAVIVVLLCFLAYFGILVVTLSRSIYLYGFRKGFKNWFEEQSV